MTPPITRPSRQGGVAGDFIPGTREIPIGRGVVYRPIRSWHSGTYAGERLEVFRGDKSGCATQKDGLAVCLVPKTVTHRLYWHTKHPDATVSAFLSYPNAMGFCDTYFWEILADDVERFATEEECEARILNVLAKRTRKAPK